jgi:hypothetical protein
MSRARGRWSRRQLLRATGAAGLLFPFLRPGRASALPPTPRLVLLMQSNGTLQRAFWPAVPAPPAPEPGATPPAPAPTVPLAGAGGAPAAAAAPSPILAPILAGDGAGAGSLAAKTMVLRGLRNDAGGAGNGHDQGFTGLYSGYRSVGSFTDPWGAGISIDQTLRSTLTFSEPFPTLNCGVLASDTPPFKAHRRSFSYVGAGRQVPTDVDPYRLYARYFALGAAGEDPVLAARRRLRRKSTVLDYAREDLRALRPALGKLDREKLDAHETTLREMEQRLGATLMPGPDRPAHCAAGGAAAALTEGLDVRAEDNAPRLTTLMFDFMALALSCQLTRVVTFQFGHGGEKWYFRWLGINENSHDDIAHKDTGNTHPAVVDKLLRINVWYAQQVAYLARALDRLPEGEGTVLDNTLMVWGNEVATGPHAMADIPVVLLGRAAGRIKNPGVLVDAGAQDYHRLGTTLLNVMGVPATGFGEEPSCGALAGVAL